MFEVGKRYPTRNGGTVEVFRVEEKENWFPIKVRREDGTFYTVTREGKRLWNQNDPEDLLNA